MEKFKKIIFFVSVLAIFMVSGFLLGRNTDFYQEVNKPIFAPKGIVFSIVWVVLYIIQSYYITYIFYLILVHYKLLQDIEYSSLCCTVNPYFLLYE